MKIRVRVVLDFIGELFEKYKLVRRVMIVWACWLITVTIYKFYGMADKLNDPAARVIIAVIGLLAVVIGFYQWSRGKDAD